MVGQDGPIYRSWYDKLTRVKTIDQVMAEIAEDEEAEGVSLNKTLTVFDVISYGVGSTVGAGIFVVTGQAAREAGPAVVLSFVLASLACFFSAMAYSEYAARVPVSGSAYTFTYTSLGELAAWFIGWNLTLEYSISAAAVARGWASNLVLFIKQVGGHPPSWLDDIKLSDSFRLSPLAALIVILCTILLCYGVKESARFNMFITIMNVSVIIFIISLGSSHVQTSNWTDHGGFAPNGINGIVTGGAKAFFSYIGFDAVTTLSEEVKNPKRDIPIGACVTLALATALYIGTTLVVTGMGPWHELNQNTPLASAFVDVGVGWAATLIAAVTVTALTATTICSLFGQPRVFYRMARDGLIFKLFGKLDPKSKVPVLGTAVCGIPSAVLAFFMDIDTLSDMISIGTLMAFSTVCIGIVLMRYKNEERPRTPLAAISVYVVFTIVLSILLRHTDKVPLGVIIAMAVVTIVPIGFIYTMPVRMENLPTGFACPLVPLLPMLGVFTNVYLICSLDWESYLRIAIWTFLGMGIYAFYGFRYSRLGLNQSYMAIGD